MKSVDYRTLSKGYRLVSAGRNDTLPVVLIEVATTET